MIWMVSVFEFIFVQMECMILSDSFVCVRGSVFYASFARYAGLRSDACLLLRSGLVFNVVLVLCLFWHKQFDVYDVFVMIGGICIGDSMLFLVGCVPIASVWFYL